MTGVILAKIIQTLVSELPDFGNKRQNTYAGSNSCIRIHGRLTLNGRHLSEQSSLFTLTNGYTWASAYPIRVSALRTSSKVCGSSMVAGILYS